VELAVTDKSNREWRALGTQTLFAEAIATTGLERKGSMESSLMSSQVLTETQKQEEVGGDFTFLTNFGAKGDGPTNPYTNDAKTSELDRQSDLLMPSR
jgi:hypothetical protein